MTPSSISETARELVALVAGEGANAAADAMRRDATISFIVK